MENNNELDKLSEKKWQQWNKTEEFEDNIKTLETLEDWQRFPGIRKDGQIIWTIRRNTLIGYNGKPAILGNSVISWGC
jgi:hypothetical protein